MQKRRICYISLIVLMLCGSIILLIQSPYSPYKALKGVSLTKVLKTHWVQLIQAQGLQIHHQHQLDNPQLENTIICDMDGNNKALYDSLVKDGYYTKSYEEFNAQFASHEKAMALFSAMQKD